MLCFVSVCTQNTCKQRTLFFISNVFISIYFLTKMSDDEDVPQLSADTLAILNNFLEEKKQEAVSENWQLSQFWYDEDTTKRLCDAAVTLSRGGRIALISCPTLMQPLLDRSADAYLFEFDKRFSQFGERFTFYDYRQPEDIPDFWKGSFETIVVDPPFLSSECLTKALSTVCALRKCASTPVILCTGTLMKDVAQEVQLTQCSFVPKHKNNLANDFCCFTNFGELPE